MSASTPKRKAAAPLLCGIVLTALVAALPSRVRGAGETLESFTPEELGYSVAHWAVEDGLPQRVITSLAQTPDGYLWGGTTAGLLRFDGSQFRLFSGRDVPELKDVEVLELLCDSAGRLWIGGISGQIVVYEQGRFRRFDERDGIPSVREPKLGQDPHGDVWVNGRSTGKLYRYQNGRFEAVTWPGMKPDMIDRFRANQLGEIWAVHEQERTLLHLTANGIQRYDLNDPERQPDFGRFFDLQDGSLAVTSTNGIYAFEGANWELRHRFSVPMPSPVFDGIQDRLGNFWIGSYQSGLLFSEAHGLAARITLPDTAPDTFIRCLLLDSEGNVWAGGNDGLYRLRRKAFQPMPVVVRQGHETYSSAVVEDANRGIWLIDYNGWYRPNGNSWTYDPHGHPYYSAWAAAAIPDGSVLVGYKVFGTAPRFLEQIKPTGERRSLATLPDNVDVMFASRTGTVWLGARALWKLEAGRLQAVPREGTNSFGQVQALAEDSDGRLFVGDQGNGLFQQTARGWQKLTTKNDVESDRILGMHFDTGGTLWIATSRGIARWKNGRWFAHELDPDLYVQVRAITCDHEGYLWMISALGVNRITLQSLNDLADGRATGLVSERFTRADGLPTLEGTGRQASLLLASDGRIWAATQKGFAVMDPAEWKRRRQLMRPAPVHIESVLVDDQIVPGIIPKEFVVPPGKRRVEIRFAAVSLQGGKNRYRYRLDGADEKWVDLGEQRFAVFHGLPPGRYHFQVIAEDKYGLKDEAGATVSFEVQPHWWQTTWFKGSALVATLVALWLSRTITLRQVERQKQRREEFTRLLIQSQEAERKRIAGELHDSLGQNLLVIKSGVTMALRQLDNPQKLRNRLEELGEISTGAVKEVREISHALRPVQLDELGLTKAIAALLGKVGEAGEFKIRSQVESIDGLLSPDFEINFFRVIQECLSNIQKHAQAASVEFAIRVVGEGGIHMTIADDGRGFDPAVKEANRGLGLRSIQERVHAMGGTVSIRTRTGGGTRIEFSIPARKTTA